MVYGARIKDYRMLRKLSQEDVAEQTGLPLTAISKIEHGTRKVTFEEAVRFAEVLRVRLDDLAGIPSTVSYACEIVHECKATVHDVVLRLSSLEQRLAVPVA